MQVVRLNSTSYLPEANIENYFSFIWSERYDTAGDFELKTLQVASTMAAMPLDSLISHLDASEVMRVEAYTIDVDKNKRKVLTVTGRTFETVYEGRPSRPWDFGDDAPMRLHDPTAASDGDDSVDYTFQNQTQGLSVLTLLGDWANDTSAIQTSSVIPNYDLRDDTRSTAAFTYTVDPSRTLYETAIDMLQDNNLALRNVRPGPDGAAVLPGEERTRKLLTRIYQGRDLRTSVHLSYKAEHFLDGQYAMSIVNTYTGAFAFSYYRTGTYISGPTGRSRRIGFVDGSSYKKKTYSAAEVNSLKAKAKAFTTKHRPKWLFNGKVSPTVPYVYNKHYRMGDIIRVTAEYGVDAAMRVVEYIRTEDSSGDSGYPTFEAI